MLKKKKNNKGFTLVELLVVIAIIGILAVVAVPALFKNIEKGKVADLESDISAIRSAALSVYADTSTYSIGEVTGTGNTAIDKELEGLSKPFGGTYTTEYAKQSTGTANNTDILLLKIAPVNGISQDGVQKLKDDLGDKYVNDKGTVTNAAAISSGSNIYIKLIEK